MCRKNTKVKIQKLQKTFQKLQKTKNGYITLLSKFAVYNSKKKSKFIKKCLKCIKDGQDLRIVFVCGPYTKNQEVYKNLQKYNIFIKINYVKFFFNLTWFMEIKNPKYVRHQGRLASMVQKLLNKETSGSGYFKQGISRRIAQTNY